MVSALVEIEQPKEASEPVGGEDKTEPEKEQEQRRHSKQRQHVYAEAVQRQVAMAPVIFERDAPVRRQK